MDITKEQWNSFVGASPYGSFLQSWEWGQLQQELHVPYWRLGLEDGQGQLAAAALVIKRELPWQRCWLYVPHGPIFRTGIPEKKIWEQLLTQLLDVAREQNAMFLRIDPKIPEAMRESLHEALGDTFNFQKAEREVQPRHTLLLDVTKPEEQLLAEMHPKTRYNIRLAEKKGVATRFSKESAALNNFLNLSEDVSERSAFRFHPAAYYRAMQHTLGEAGLLEVAIAEQGGEVLAVHLLLSFGDTVTYAHGASSSRQRELMAPHLLQWESIRRAKALGKHWYDFFGIAPEDADTSHSWSGITRFKTGFGGQRATYIGAHDLILDPTWYNIFNVARRVRRLLR